MKFPHTFQAATVAFHPLKDGCIRPSCCCCLVIYMHENWCVVSSSFSLYACAPQLLFFFLILFSTVWKENICQACLATTCYLSTKMETISDCLCILPHMLSTCNLLCSVALSGMLIALDIPKGQNDNRSCCSNSH